MSINSIAHTYNIPDNPLTRYEIYLVHKELFVFNFLTGSSYLYFAFSRCTCRRVFICEKARAKPVSLLYMRPAMRFSLHNIKCFTCQVVR